VGLDLMGTNVQSSQERETARLEAFSDGVFAFAITLLVLNLRDPVSGGTSLFQGLLGEWPTFFAFVTSFSTILIMWMNHHNMFNYVSRIDREFMLLNGSLLFFVTLTPFTTSLVATHILSNDSSTAAVVYSGSFFLLAIVWNITWRYASTGLRLLGSHVTTSQARGISRQYRFAPPTYAVALVTAFVNAVASVAVIILIAAYFAITATTSE
jgi:uncharacterized membrane protein